MKNAKFYKRSYSLPCWYCEGKSHGVMVFVQGDEIPVCHVCFKENVKRIHKTPIKQKSSISGVNSRVEFQENLIIGEVSHG